MRLTVGASRMSTPLLLASTPRAVASRWTSSASQVAPTADGQGRLAEGCRSSLTVPRTPAGPSEVSIGRRPISGLPWVHQLSAPVSSRTFSASGRAATISRSEPRAAAGADASAPAGGAAELGLAVRPPAIRAGQQPYLLGQRQGGDDIAVGTEGGRRC